MNYMPNILRANPQTLIFRFPLTVDASVSQTQNPILLRLLPISPEYSAFAFFAFEITFPLNAFF